MNQIEENLLREEVALIGRISVIPNILEVICQSTGMGFAAVARVTKTKWIACAVKDDIGFGLKPGGELDLETTICYEIMQNHKEVVIDDVDKDDHFSSHHTPEMYGFKSYISVPIISKKGDFFGTLCAIDPKPNQLNNAKVLNTFHLFSDLIAFHMNMMGDLADSKSELEEERGTALLRDQFIAILGHDLRNPLSSVMNVAKLLLKSPEKERVNKLAHILQDSSFRMKALVDNILDFAKGRLGDGISLNMAEHDLITSIGKVVEESKMAWPNHNVKIIYNVSQHLICDAERIEQLLSNLISNALSYGIKGEPVVVSAQTEDGYFLLSVTNASEKIPDELIKQLFKPFVRGQAKSNNNGLGLGLYITDQIAKAHGGKMEVFSNDQETRFTFKMKLPA